MSSKEHKASETHYSLTNPTPLKGWTTTMKNRILVIASALAAFKFADDPGTAGTPLQGGIVNDVNTLPYGERAKSIFAKIPEWTPGQLRNAVEVSEAKLLRDPEGNTLMHRAIETGNIALVETLKQEYGFIGTLPNKQGETAFDLAEKAGEEFVSVFGDMKPSGVAV